MKKRRLILFLISIPVFFSGPVSSGTEPGSVRERLLLDQGWRFALGDSFDAGKDFGHGTGYFSFFTKTGYGDGPAAGDFDDRGWRILDLPHDWCVELPFDSTGGHSHGYRAIGRNFPQNSVGWYRRKFFVPESHIGRKITIEFEGVHRDSKVWVNGFYLGTEHSGYIGFNYDISDYLNYGSDNSIVVRADATMEEGWYYEGAGIYRHVWLIKTDPLHVERYGTFITTDLENGKAEITIRSTVINESLDLAEFDVENVLFDDRGNYVTSGSTGPLHLKPGEQKTFYIKFVMENPILWTLETPHLYRLQTVIHKESEVIDIDEACFGIRTVRFDANEGFFLNGKSVKLLGVNMHQDHAGVGTAIPDALQEYRIMRLKEMGCNAIRTAHNPPAPALLDACDRLGMLVLDENRLMGINEEHYSCLERLIKRDRNHPSVILWSLGNEEWAIESNIKGARITESMQAFAQRLDSSRAFTVAVSGGWDNGSGMKAQVMGYNYIVQGDIDRHHTLFPWQAGVGTEETNFKQTRGVYKTDERICHMAPTRRIPENVDTETGWQFYAERPFLAGLFYWTGFDYRGESNPFEWPAVINQAGNFDLCGFPKDSYYYLKSWWSKEPVLYMAPYWNDWQKGEEVPVTVYSNCEEVELFLNSRSLGRKIMPLNGHLEWRVGYQPGVLSSRGYRDEKSTLTYKTETTSEATAIRLTADRSRICADGKDVSVITVEVRDSRGRLVPDASQSISFSLQGPGRIIGVGNGNPSSHEPDRFFKTVKTTDIRNLKELTVSGLENRPETGSEWNDSEWSPAFRTQSKDWRVYTDSLIVVRGIFELPEFTADTRISLFTKSITENQSMYVNGHCVASDVQRGDPDQSYLLRHEIVRPGRNVYAVTGKRFRKSYQWDEPNEDPGLVQLIIPSQPWRRKVFNGLAQVIVQSSGKRGEICLTASSPGLKSAVIRIHSADLNKILFSGYY